MRLPQPAGPSTVISRHHDGGERALGLGQGLNRTPEVGDGVVGALERLERSVDVASVRLLVHVEEREVEEAAATLGASRIAIFTRVILPVVLPALITGFALAFARAIGEFGWRGGYVALGLLPLCLALAGFVLLLGQRGF